MPRQCSRALDAPPAAGILLGWVCVGSGGARMGEECRVVIWSPVSADGPSAEFVEAVREACPGAILHAGDEPPEGRADVIVIWAAADAPDIDARARAVRRSGLARVVVVAAPGAHGMLAGSGLDEPTHIVKLDPSWDQRAVATLVRGALAGARESARAAEIAEAQESFIAIASHDLRTPVSTLRLLHDLFRSKLSARTEPLSPRELSDFDELLEIMERNLEKMDVFIGDILEAWRLYRGRPQPAMEPMSLNSVAEDIVAGLFPSAIKKDLALDLVVDPSLGPIMAEPRRVGQVVANLVENAIKYTPRGGTVTVRTFPDAERNGAVLEVADTGPGVPEEERGKLFQRFGRGSARTTGGEPSTGLGLFICREIVEQHGGRVWFEPAEDPGVGSRFFAFWPQDETPSEDRNSPGDGPASGGG